MRGPLLWALSPRISHVSVSQAGTCFPYSTSQGVQWSLLPDLTSSSAAPGHLLLPCLRKGTTWVLNGRLSLISCPSQDLRKGGRANSWNWSWHARGTFYPDVPCHPIHAKFLALEALGGNAHRNAAPPGGHRALCSFPPSPAAPRLGRWAGCASWVRSCAVSKPSLGLMLYCCHLEILIIFEQGPC